MLGQNQQLEIYQDRFRYLYFVITAVAILLVFRLWYLQILQGEKFKRFSEENRLKKIKIVAPRGMIFDRNRKLLIDNQPTFSLTITPQYFKAASKRQQNRTIKKISKIIHLPRKTIKRILRKNRRQPSFQPIVIKKNLTQDEVALTEMEKLDLAGVDVAVGIRRTNMFKEVGSQLVGYIAKINPEELPRLNRAGRKYNQDDYIGKFGIEQQWNSTLRGVDGLEYLEVDARGRKKKSLKKKQGTGSIFSELTSRLEVPGKNIILTIDQDLQIAAAKAFGEEKTGALVAIDPNNGEILSMLSWPSFRSTEFSIGISPKYWQSLLNNKNKPLRDKTIQDHYSPGSVFKIVASIAGLEENLINENTIINAAGSFRFGGRVYHDWKKEGFGKTGIIKALTRSVDVFFYKLATRMDVDTLAKYGKMLGLGSKTDINLPGEIAGILPSRAWKKKATGKEWYSGETLSMIIGQSYLTTTPIQLANLIAAIANGGTLYRPRVVKYIENSDGEVISSTQPEILRENHFAENTLKIIKRGLWGVLNHKNGTARWHAIPGIVAAGKTGTTQLIRFAANKVYGDCQKLEWRFRHHGLFVAFAPFDNPKIAVAVVAEHSCAGSSGAAPIAMAVIKKYLSKTMPDKYGPEILKKAQIKFWQKWRKAQEELEQKKEAESTEES